MRGDRGARAGKDGPTVWCLGVRHVPLAVIGRIGNMPHRRWGTISVVFDTQELMRSALAAFKIR